MIYYTNDNPFSFIRCHGSVAPTALKWAVPCSLLSALYHAILHRWTDLASLVYPVEPSVYETTGWSLFTSVLGFLLVFRANLSFGRYWEGITLVERACGVWLNGCSNLVAFCSPDPAKKAKVEEFQFTLSRLMSLLFCYSMCDISKLDRDRFPHLDLGGIDPTSIAFLESTSAKQNVVLQWLQKLVVENARSGVIDVAPPILSRVFQEFSIGYVHLIDARKITSVPFPFGFAQIVWILLAFFCAIPVPLICAFGMSMSRAATYTLVIVFIFRSVHCMAVELELPFGDDPNDLPLDKVNRRFNRILLRLLDKRSQQVPSLATFADTAMQTYASERSSCVDINDTSASENAPTSARPSRARRTTLSLSHFLKLPSMRSETMRIDSNVGSARKSKRDPRSSLPTPQPEPTVGIARRSDRESLSSTATPRPEPTTSPSTCTARHVQSAPKVIAGSGCCEERDVLVLPRRPQPPSSWPDGDRGRSESRPEEEERQSPACSLSVHHGVSDSSSPREDDEEEVHRSQASCRPVPSVPRLHKVSFVRPEDGTEAEDLESRYDRI